MKKSIYYILAGSLVVTLLIVVSCSEDDKLPSVNGFNHASEVAADNLLAYWSFDGTTDETISETSPTTADGDSFTDNAVKGQALSLDDGYMVYPAITALNTADAFPSVTVSCWVKLTNNNASVSHVFGITQETNVQAGWNNGTLNLYAETGKPIAYNDTLVLQANFSTYINDEPLRGNNINDYGNRGVDFQTVKGTDRWVHYVMRWDASGSNIDIYADGVRVSNNNFRHRTYNPGSGDVGLGDINQLTPTHVIMGAFPTVMAGYPNAANEPWMDFLTGDIDEVRVYDKALSDLEIGSLYALELSGR